MSKDPIIPPYNPYDPAQNELLSIQPSLKQPTMLLEHAQAYLSKVESILSNTKEYIRIRGAMNKLEYITSYNHCCLNPIEIAPDNTTQQTLTEVHTKTPVKHKHDKTKPKKVQPA